MEENSYRILIYKDVESGKVIAQVPELRDCQIEAETQLEALKAIQEKIEDVVAEIKAEGDDVPTPIDEKEYPAEVTMELSPWLQREIDWQATKENIEKERMISEILADGLARRNWKRHGKRRSKGRQDSGRRGRREDVSKNRYMGIMEDRASFIEYVRGLDSGGGGRGGRGGRGGGGRHNG